MTVLRPHSSSFPSRYLVCGMHLGRAVGRQADLQGTRLCGPAQPDLALPWHAFRGNAPKSRKPQGEFALRSFRSSSLELQHRNRNLCPLLTLFPSLIWTGSLFPFSRLPLLTFAGARLHPLSAFPASDPLCATLPPSEPLGARPPRKDASVRPSGTNLMRRCAPASVPVRLARSSRRTYVPAQVRFRIRERGRD